MHVITECDGNPLPLLVNNYLNRYGLDFNVVEGLFIDMRVCSQSYVNGTSADAKSNGNFTWPRREAVKGTVA